MPSDRRECLLTTAAQEFAAHGFEGASLNRILEAAQIGKSSAYYYFEDKADLFCTTVGYALERLQLAPTGDVFTGLTAATFWPTIAEIHERALLRAQELPWLFGTLRAAEHLAPESAQQPSLAELVRSLARYQLTGMGAMVQRGQDLGLIRTDLPQELLVAWFRAIDAATDDWLTANLGRLDQAAIHYISQHTMATIRQALALPPPSV
jgi:AcrR family transcriptional regulator